MVKENFTLTEDMKFGEAHAIAILAYTIMFVVGLTTNTISLVRMMQVRIAMSLVTVVMVMPQGRIQRKDRSKMTLLLIHLSVADLTVSIMTSNICKVHVLDYYYCTKVQQNKIKQALRTRSCVLRIFSYS